MSESNEAIEVTAPSVDEAIRQALDQLGAAEDDVVIQVLSTPRAGVLGLGARQARVRVERRAVEGARSGVMSPPPAPPSRQPEPARPPERRQQQPQQQRQPQPAQQPRQAQQPPPRSPQERTERQVEASVLREEIAAGDDESVGGRKAAGLDDQAREATTILSQILERMGERGDITTAEADSEGIELAIKGDGSGLLIGRHGQTLDSLEYLVNRILARRVKDAVPITIDTESYRERRRRQLHRMALSMAEQTKREHVPVTLDPMPPRDRRIVHLALKDDPLITTRSTGDGFLRAVEIVPVGERRESGGGRGGRPRGGGGRGRERERERESEPARERDQPIGQQGGFRHGQKRMF
jgi:spoIIIJ-associated protein